MAHIKRTVTITADSEKLVFDNTKQLCAFHEALGRMIQFGTTKTQEDSDVRGQILIGKDCTDVEICFTYRKASNPEERGFTMAAIARNNGEEYTFHS